MKIFYYLLIPLLLLSCKKDEEVEKAPVSKFEINDYDGFAPAEITFTNLSTNAEDYIWDFGDGTSSLDFEPSHYYSLPGTYLVELVVYGAGGKDVSVASVVLRKSGYGRFTIENKTDITLLNVRSFYLDWETYSVFDVVEHGDLISNTSTDEVTTSIPTIEVLFEFEDMFFHLGYPTDAIEGELVNIVISDTTSCFIYETDPILDDEAIINKREIIKVKQFLDLKINDLNRLKQ